MFCCTLVRIFLVVTDTSKGGAFAQRR